ncbi:hypothetical protein AYK24_09795 [Thermoplasmatales archaeon SG8-52-4]|nr:MAG: hypothetical protein AYK24_09795 [Thermoplasmatales archaeon SG8-52-4]
MKLIPKNKKAQLTSTVVGIGMLIVTVIVILVILSTIIDADLFNDSRDSSTRTNQTVLVNSTVAVEFGYPTYADSTCTADTVVNATGGETIASANYTVSASACTIIATAGSEYNNTNWNITSTTTFDGIEEQAVTDIGGNFTTGLDNVSEQLPTILLVVAVVVLLAVLVLLVAQSRKAGMGGGSL